MCLTLLGVLCNYHGYRPLADFCKKHCQTLQTMLELPSDIRIPSYSTRCVIQGIEIGLVVELFNDQLNLVKTLDIFYQGVELVF